MYDKYYQPCRDKMIHRLKQAGNLEENTEAVNWQPRKWLEPEVEPKFIDLDEFDDYRPEKMEYEDGEIFAGGRPDLLLKMLLTYFGLKEVVKFAPKKTWIAALKENSESKELNQEFIKQLKDLCNNMKNNRGNLGIKIKLPSGEVDAAKVKRYIKERLGE